MRAGAGPFATGYVAGWLALVLLLLTMVTALCAPSGAEAPAA